MLSNHLIPCHFLLLLPSIFLKSRVIPNESALLIRWPKYWRFKAASVLPVNIQGWFPLVLTGFISLQSKGPSRVFSSTTILRHQFFTAGLSLWSNSHKHIGKRITLSTWSFACKVVSLLFNTLSRFVIAFLLRSKHLLISWLQSASTVVLEDKKALFPLFPLLFVMKWWDQMPWFSFFLFF